MSRSRVIKVIWLFFIVFACYFIYKNSSVKTDISQFLPSGVDSESTLLMKMLQDGPGARVIIVELTNAHESELASITKSLAIQLGKTGNFQKILGTEISLSAQDENLIFKYRYLLSRVDLSLQRLQLDLKKRLEELSYGAIIDRQYFVRDPVNAYLNYLHKLSSMHAKNTHLGVWFSEDRKHSYLLLYSASAALDLNAQERAIDSIYQSFELVNHKNVEIQLTGPPVIATQSRTEIKKSTQFISIISTFGILMLIYFSFRSLNRVLLISIPLLSGILAGTVSVLIVFDQIHAITLAFGITIIGIAIDYPIHLYSHGGTRKAAKLISSTLILSTLTTSIGFLALISSGFDGLQQMGVFSIVGISISAIVTHWVLPEFEIKEIYLHNNYGKLASKIIYHCNRVNIFKFLFVLSAISIIYLSYSHNDLWDKNINRLSPVSQEQMNIDQQLRNRINAPEPGEILLISESTQELVLQKTEEIVFELGELVNHSLLGSYDSPSFYLPSQALQSKRQKDIPEKNVIDLTMLQAMKDLPFKQNIFQPFVNDLTASKEIPLLDYSMLKDTLLEMRLNSLLFSYANEWHAIIPLNKVHDISVIMNLAKKHRFQVVSTTKKVNEIIVFYLNKAFFSIVIGLLLVIILLQLSLKSFNKVISVFLPVLSIVAITMFLITLINMKLNLFHVISLLVVIGISLDYFLYVERFKNKSKGYDKIASSLLMCSTTTLLVFGVLAFSSIPVLHAIGLTVSLGVMFALILSLASIGLIAENDKNIKKSKIKI